MSARRRIVYSWTLFCEHQDLNTHFLDFFNIASPKLRAFRSVSLFLILALLPEALGRPPVLRIQFSMLSRR